MAKYNYNKVVKIEFTDEDIASVTRELTKAEKQNTIATLTMGDDVPARVVTAFAALASALRGTVTTQYGGLAVVVPKTADEIKATERNNALYVLRYNDEHAALRDQRALESGVEPDPEPEAEQN